MQDIITCLKEIEADVESGKLEITSEYEDIHSFVEANLIDRLGDTGKKLHTGRSRNDQVALDMRLYTRLQVLETDELLEKLFTGTSSYYEREYADNHAGIYTLTESTADYTGTSYGGIF